MFKKLIIDCEVRVVHEKARKPNFLSHSKEKIVQDIYKHPKINKAMKLWGVESLIKSMNKNKIKYALLSGLAWRNQKVLNDNNEYVSYCLDTYKDRFLGLYNASTYNPKQSAKKIMKLDKKKYVGVEIIPKWQNTNINDHRLKPIIKAVKKRKMFLKIYTAHPTQTLDGDAPYRTLQFLKMNPNLKVILPHLGGLLSIYGLFSPIKKIIKNVFFITSVSETMKMVEFSSKVNSKNLLFGTDFPFNNSFDQFKSLCELKKLKVPKKIKLNILGKNSSKLLGFDKKG